MSSKASPIVLDDTEPEDEGPSTPRAAINVIPPTSPVVEPASTPTSHPVSVATHESSPEPLASVSAMDEDEPELNPEPGTDDAAPAEPMDVDDAEPADGEQADDESESDSDSEDDDEEAQGPSHNSEEDITRSPRRPSPPASQVPTTNGTAPAAAASEPAETTPAAAATLGTSSKPNSKAKPTSQVGKPKSKRVHKSPTPPPAPPPPLQTVRLEIKLGRGSNREYAFDLAQMAEDKGLRIRPPAPRKIDTDSEPDSAVERAKALDAAAAAADAAESAKKKKKRKRVDEQYDLEDDFIDDSELAIEERKFFAQTKQTGFYVSSGEVALLREKGDPATKHRSPKKPAASTAPSTPIPIIPPSIPIVNKPNAKRSSLARTLQTLPGRATPRESDAMKALVKTIAMPPPLNQGTQDNPIPLDGKEEDEEGDGEEKHEEVLTGGRGTKRKASMGGAGLDGQPERATPGDGDMVAEPRKRRKVHDLPQFSKELQPEIEMLKALVDREEQAFSIRGKFPQHVKPVLAQVALKAIVLDEYDEEFFDAMPKIFPYNRFTMKKLITRIVYPLHMDLLNKRTDELLVELKKVADEGFEHAKAEHQRAVAAWEHKQAKKKADAADAAEVAPPVAVENGGDGATGEREDKPPKQKYKLTEAMRTIIWNLVCLSNDSATLTNEKNKLENVTDSVSEQGLRKVLYQKINNCFPDGWMDTGILSREVSSLKKKQGRENMAELPDGAT